MLFGPPALGLLADASSVRWALTANAVLLAAAAAYFGTAAQEPGRQDSARRREAPAAAAGDTDSPAVR